MKREYMKLFWGAFTGMLAYQFLIDFRDPFGNEWANSLTEIALMSAFAFLGILLVGFVMNRFIPSRRR